MQQSKRHRYLTNRFFPKVSGTGETKLDIRFPNAPFFPDDYYNLVDFSKDRTCNDAGLMLCIREGTPCKSLRIFEETGKERICFEISV